MKFKKINNLYFRIEPKNTKENIDKGKINS